ncbi:hypothetical protein ULMS_16250 [Patiriisocius marinistellae]|uniref:HTH araC/xylS-type domain-containing protein n=1 Tax=Patiriisocius marinistellae TaxID=2494560 RepID=A0A5J4FU27_9FLAO|nr:helix-turn-helix transcriptional regulator [Patiriisocius marinistellae]GEQ86117.1 hypothetical protein ULMS_16250 [Patiriisocius marinistellae]
MIRYVFYILISLLLSVVSYGQENAIETLNFNKSINTIYQDPDQTIKIANYFLKKSPSKIDNAKALYLRSESQKLKGNNAQSIEDLYQAKNILESINENYITSLVLVGLAQQCRYQGMHNVSKSYLSNATSLITYILDPYEKDIALSKLHQEQSAIFISESHFNDAFEILLKQNNNNDAIKKIVPGLYLETENLKAQIKLASDELESAKTIFNESLIVLKSQQLEDSSIKAVTQLGLGEVYFNENEHKIAKGFLLESLQVNIIEPKIKLRILNLLSKVYKQLDSISLSQKYYTESSLLSASLVNDERSVRNVLLSKIEENQKDTLEKDLNNYYVLGALIFTVLLIILLSYYFYNRKLDREYRQFEKIIKQIENKEKLEMVVIENATNNVKETKGVFIPSGTKNAILARLEAFENSDRFINPNMSLALLAKQLKTNTKYISEIIRTHKNKNFNTYINELRINYIINLMQGDAQYLNYKVSYLAEKCGFSSHSSFTVVFKSITDITPKQFVVFLKKNNKVAS